VRSLSVLGRFEPGRMQVVAPSLWYVILVAQLYVLFPALQRLHVRLGSARFVACGLLASWAARAFVFWVAPVPGFGAHDSVVCFVPFRLAGPVFGMAAAHWLARREPARLRTLTLAIAPAIAAFVAAVFLAVDIHTPRTLVGLLGSALPLALAMPALWLLASAAPMAPRAAALLVWTGRRSLSLLVVQDVLRFAVGTAIALGARLDGVFWLVLLPYVGVALALTALWHPVQDAATARLLPERRAVDAYRAAA
jgi:hypothetical protein